MTPEFPLKAIIEAALLATDHPLSLDDFSKLWVETTEPPSRATVRAALLELQQECLHPERGIELIETASGFRFQTKTSLAPWLKLLFTERPPRYSRALLETLAIIAYRQPITRQEVESIRGISVSTEILKKLQDYNWIRILAHRETPGHPALYGTTRTFLDYFGLKSLEELPTLLELNQNFNLEPPPSPTTPLLNQHEETTSPGETSPENEINSVPQIT